MAIGKVLKPPPKLVVGIGEQGTIFLDSLRNTESRKKAQNITKFFEKRTTFICNGLFTTSWRDTMASRSARGGYRGKPKPKLPEHLKRVPVNARIQKWMLDQLKEKGEVGYILEEILTKSGFRYREK